MRTPHPDQLNSSATQVALRSIGLHQITQMRPVRAVSRQYWKTFSDGVNCPYAVYGSVTSCDYYFDLMGICQALNMTPYFGRHLDARGSHCMEIGERG